MKKWLLGIDVGTPACKVLFFHRTVMWPDSWHLMKN